MSRKWLLSRKKRYFTKSSEEEEEEEQEQQLTNFMDRLQNSRSKTCSVIFVATPSFIYVICIHPIRFFRTVKFVSPYAYLIYYTYLIPYVYLIGKSNVYTPIRLYAIRIVFDI